MKKRKDEFVLIREREIDSHADYQSEKYNKYSKRMLKGSF